MTTSTPSGVNPCVVLGIDPAAKSGWAIARPKPLPIDCGVATTQRERELVVASAARIAALLELPLVVVAERWTRGGRHDNRAMHTGLGKAWGMWLAELERIEHPKRRIIRVDPGTWRRGVLGLAGRYATREACQAAALRWARAQGIATGDGPEAVDAAEAAIIAWWGARSSDVGAVLPKRRA